MTVRGYRDLVAWQKSYALALECYKLARVFPSSEQFGLTTQLRRAAVSVPANIAEGNGRMYRGDYLRHLRIAHASLKELDTHLQFAKDLAYLPSKDADTVLALVAEVGRILGGLIKSLDVLPAHGARKKGLKR